MTKLGRESIALIAAARKLDRMSADDKARIRRKIAQRIGTGLAAGTTVALSATTAQATHATWLITTVAWLPSVAKVVGMLTISGAIGALGVSAVQGLRSTTPTVERAPRAVQVAVSGPRPIRSRTAPANAPQPAIEVPPTTAAKTVRKGRLVPKAVELDGDTEITQTDDALGQQVAAIRESRAALRRGDAQSALAALDRTAAEEQGPLTQEAMLARVSALCLKGDAPSARRVANEFIARFADSLLVPQLRTTCAFDSDPSR